MIARYFILRSNLFPHILTLMLVIFRIVILVRIILSFELIWLFFMMRSISVSQPFPKHSLIHLLTSVPIRLSCVGIHHTSEHLFLRH